MTAYVVVLPHIPVLEMFPVGCVSRACGSIYHPTPHHIHVDAVMSVGASEEELIETVYGDPFLMGNNGMLSTTLACTP